MWLKLSGDPYLLSLTIFTLPISSGHHSNSCTCGMQIHINITKTKTFLGNLSAYPPLLLAKHQSRVPTPLINLNNEHVICDNNIQ